MAMGGGSQAAAGPRSLSLLAGPLPPLSPPNSEAPPDPAAVEAACRWACTRSRTPIGPPPREFVTRHQNAAHHHHTGLPLFTQAPWGG